MLYHDSSFFSSQMQIFISNKVDGNLAKSLLDIDEGSSYYDKVELSQMLEEKTFFDLMSIQMDLPGSSDYAYLVQNYSMVENASVTVCNYTYNPWCGMFGSQQVFEVVYLVLLTLLGIFGNLLVIFSILLEKKLHKHANIFIANLAFADFLVSRHSFLCLFAYKSLKN